MTGYFLPEMGIDPQLRLPLFVGVLIIVFVTQGGVSGLILALDLEREKTLIYHLSLPVHPLTVMSAYY